MGSRNVHGSSAGRSRAAADGNEPNWLYGLHTVAAALANPRRVHHRFVATRNALRRLPAEALAAGPPAEEADVRSISRLVGTDAVHQGVALLADPLTPRPLEALAGARLVVILDQITDPHNVGAIMRSAVAFAADAIITTSRHSPAERGVLAKSASGALDLIDHIEVPNLARAVATLRDGGYVAIALDSDGATRIESLPPAERIAIVLGAEGKGVRPGVRSACDHLARIDLPGAIQSLNVSNAAVLTLYLARTRLAAGALS